MIRPDAPQASTDATRDAGATPGPKMMPRIDQVHRLTHLWKAGDQVKVDQYPEDHGLRQSVLAERLYSGSW